MSLIAKCDQLVRDILWATETRCFISGKPISRETATVGHFRKRRHLTTRWHLMNCHLILNKYQDEGDPQNELLYAKAIDKKYGRGTAERLEILSHMRHFEDLIDIYNKLKSIKNGNSNNHTGDL